MRWTVALLMGFFLLFAFDGALLVYAIATAEEVAPSYAIERR